LRERDFVAHHRPASPDIPMYGVDAVQSLVMSAPEDHPLRVSLALPMLQPKSDG
jgi:hypothetical protein